MDDIRHFEASQNRSFSIRKQHIPSRQHVHTTHFNLELDLNNLILHLTHYFTIIIKEKIHHFPIR
jgi:hypothetical protein